MIISFPLIDYSEYEAKASHNYGEHTQQRPWSAVRRNPGRHTDAKSAHFRANEPDETIHRCVSACGQLRIGQNLYNWPLVLI
jgi:hypothetical protein